MIDDSWMKPEKSPTKDEVAFDYVKTQDFRVIWADGAVGNLTPNGLIHFALYAERPAIPRRQVYKIDQADDGTGKLGAEVLEKQITRGSVVRELACDVMSTRQSAESLAKWLLERVADLNSLLGAKS